MGTDYPKVCMESQGQLGKTMSHDCRGENSSFIPSVNKNAANAHHAQQQDSGLVELTLTPQSLPTGHGVLLLDAATRE